MSGMKAYLDRSLGVIKRNTVQTLRMNPSPKPEPITIFSFHKRPLTPLSSIATGCDADIGGVSTAELTMVEETASSTGSDSASPAASDATSSNSSSSSDSSDSSAGSGSSATPSHMAFHGTLSLHVPPEFAGRIRTGYAAFRSKTRPTLFGDETWNLDRYSHLRVRVAYRGWDGWRSKFVCNLQTDGPVRSDLFQHRLDLPSTYATSDPRPLPLATGLHFTTLHLPLSNFVLTNSGLASETQVEMMRQKVRTVGFALLGGGRQTAPSDAKIRAAQRGHRTAAGGWGAAAPHEELDAEMADLVVSDLGDARYVRPAPAARAAAGGYHRVGEAASFGEVDAAEAAEAGVEDIGEAGYYELCIQSVEAVRLDPESEVEGEE
ncbi:hypothetical protein CspeluHIS016_0200060 [Cutaneotrichosporon spelunceum]|uniref:NADH:ubiquinone oxidoreductase intermediate-associated protein 30 domain-containing protein n=1 Tax=Cutaneotrichosporon spelunceum TaxID=1672016 RepID=A0AAD3Y9F5_9TREE|nr:hypothetical protein CspeluHIS016_0200060 [Cutaneotrichosporon spelunceum]